MFGKYSGEQIQEFFSSLKEGKILDAKEFRQSRGVFVKQDGKIFGSLQQKAFVEHILNFQKEVDFTRSFQLYVISAQEPVSVKQVSSRDSLEFSYLTYKGFSLAFESNGEKIAVVEALLQRHRLPVDLWSKPGFQLFRWETQVFDVSAIGEAKEVM